MIRRIFERWLYVVASSRAVEPRHILLTMYKVLHWFNGLRFIWSRMALEPHPRRMFDCELMRSTSERKAYMKQQTRVSLRHGRSCPRATTLGAPAQLINAFIFLLRVVRVWGGVEQQRQSEAVAERGGGAGGGDAVAASGGGLVRAVEAAPGVKVRVLGLSGGLIAGGCRGGQGQR
jgi:hypothetical protein